MRAMLLPLGLGLGLALALPCLLHDRRRPPLPAMGRGDTLGVERVRDCLERHPAPVAWWRSAPASGAIPRSGATALPGRNGVPAVTFRLTIPDFARLVAEEVDPQELLFAGRFEIDGDLTLARACPRCSAPRRGSRATISKTPPLSCFRVTP
jgi:hypothetical protein